LITFLAAPSLGSGHFRYMLFPSLDEKYIRIVDLPSMDLVHTPRHGAGAVRSVMPHLAVPMALVKNKHPVAAKEDKHHHAGETGLGIPKLVTTPGYPACRRNRLRLRAQWDKTGELHESPVNTLVQLPRRTPFRSAYLGSTMIRKGEKIKRRRAHAGRGLRPCRVNWIQNRHAAAKSAAPLLCYC